MVSTPIAIATSSAKALATHGAMRSVWKILTNKWIGRGAVGYSIYDLFDDDTDWDNEVGQNMPFATGDQKEVAKALMAGTLEDIATGEILNFETNLKKIQDGVANQLFIVQQVYPPKASEDTYSMTYRPFSKTSVNKSGRKITYKK